jgi:hypothetical protein
VLVALLIFVVFALAMWALVRGVDRLHRRTWGDAPKQTPGRQSSIESTTAFHSGRSDGSSF